MKTTSPTKKPPKKNPPKKEVTKKDPEPAVDYTYDYEVPNAMHNSGMHEDSERLDAMSNQSEPLN